MQRMACADEYPPERLERAGVAVVTVDVLHKGQQPVDSIAVDGAVAGLRNAIPRIVTKPRKIPPRPRDPHYGNAQRCPLHHLVKSREDHLMSEITRRTAADPTAI